MTTNKTICCLSRVAWCAAVLLGLLCITATTIRAEPVTVPISTTWTRFFWDAVPGTAYGFIGDDISEDGFRITSTEAFFLDITDAFRPGDAFDIFVNGTRLFSTPSVASGSQSNSNPNQTFGNPLYSFGRFTLAAGTYDISIFVRQGSASGSGFVRAVPTPEPMTMLLLGSGLTVFAMRERRRRNKHSDAAGNDKTDT